MVGLIYLLKYITKITNIVDCEFVRKYPNFAPTTGGPKITEIKNTVNVLCVNYSIHPYLHKYIHTSTHVQTVKFLSFTTKMTYFGLDLMKYYMDVNRNTILNEK